MPTPPDPASSPLSEAVRDLAPRVLGTLLRRHGGLDECEDAVQEALVAAAQQWPRDGIPDNRFGWLYVAASRRLIDGIRADVARQARERSGADLAGDAVAGLDGRLASRASAPDHDDSLDLLVLCCHPALAPPAQIALALRAVAGLTTAQIAAAFFTTETTMAQRITRAKAAVRAAGATFPEPAADRPARLAAAAHVIYLLFNEGYARSAGDDATDLLLASEAIRLARMAHRLEPQDAELTALLALLLLTHARLPSRLDATGRIVPFDEHDRSRWDRALITEGEVLVERALRLGPPGPFALQAAIAAVHAAAPSPADTDWAQIAELYTLLERVAPGPMVAVGRAIAVGEAEGPAAGLALLDAAAGDARLAGHHRFVAARAHLREQVGDDPAAARADWAQAAALASNAREREYLRDRSR